MNTAAAPARNVLSDLSGNASYLSKRTKKGNAYLIAVVDGGQRIATFYVPLTSWWNHDVDVKGTVSRIDGTTGQFDPVDGEVAQTVLFFARRAITNGH